MYLVVFMDDHSRYIVSWQLALSQRTELVTDALKEGIARFGKPKEVLTDQGRQYFARRGKSEFQRLLLREGIGHVVARAHHPETLGKCERFWETVGREFWERARPQELARCSSIRVSIGRLVRASDGDGESGLPAHPTSGFRASNRARVLVAGTELAREMPPRGWACPSERGWRAQRGIGGVHHRHTRGAA